MTILALARRRRARRDALRLDAAGWDQLIGSLAYAPLDETLEISLVAA